MLDLGKIRGQIDVIDNEIVDLFQKRMQLASEVAEYKISTGKPVLDHEREEQKIESLTQLADSDFNKHGVEELFRQIMAMSRKYQYKLLAKNGVTQTLGFKKIPKLRMGDIKVVYQGVPGAYAHAAVLKFFGEDVDTYNAATWKEAMDELTAGNADYAVFPIENSTAGMVGDVYDLLVEYPNYIVAETAISINHALLGLPGSTEEGIQTVYSHPQALMQCSDFLETHKEWNRISTSNTALSALKIKELANPANAAIASVTAAKLYGLDVLKEHLSDNSHNMTKFIVVSRKNVYCEGATKLMITLEVPHSAGSLYDMLSHFIFNNVNMTKIESRPVKGKNWKYRFFIEMEGTPENNGVINALQGIQAEAENVQILGCY